MATHPDFVNTIFAKRRGSLTEQEKRLSFAAVRRFLWIFNDGAGRDDWKPGVGKYHVATVLNLQKDCQNQALRWQSIGRADEFIKEWEDKWPDLPPRWF